MNLFGFELTRKEKENVSFAPKQEDDGAVVVQGGGLYGTYLDLDGSVRSESELVNKYREMSQYPEIDEAVDDIVNESITVEAETKTVEIILDDLDQPDRIKNLIIEEFNDTIKLLEFNTHAYELFKKWYIDGRLYYHAIIDQDSPKDGIKELRYIDPRKIRKVRELKKKKKTDLPDSQTQKEFYIYNEKGFAAAGKSTISPSSTNGIKIAKDSIIHCTSGLTSHNGDLIQSYLHKAIKPLNQLASMEDSVIIYRVSRAPERRVFYIDVGNLPKMKAEQYVRDIMTKFKNKVVYNSETGEIRDQRKHMTMLEDFWLPRSAGGRGTEVSTLPGGQNLGQLDDVEYFQNKLYKSLNVPITRLNPEANFNLGRSTEISRDEIKFAKFINRLRGKFSMLFLKILERQLVLKGIITIEDWEEFKSVIRFKFATDNYYAELKEAEILRERINSLGEINDFVGLYYSHDWVRRNVLMQSDEQIKDMDEEINKETKDPRYSQPEEDTEPEPEQEPEPEPMTPSAPIVNNNFRIDGKDVKAKAIK